MKPFWGFRLTRNITYYRPNGCFTLLLVFLGTPLLWLAAIALWLHAGTNVILKDIAAVGLVALSVLGLAFLHLFVMLRQFARERAAREAAARRTGYR